MLVFIKAFVTSAVFIHKDYPALVRDAVCHDAVFKIYLQKSGFDSRNNRLGAGNYHSGNIGGYIVCPDLIAVLEPVIF